MIHTTTPKIGRNDLCPCGSGKKFKQCCIHDANTAQRRQQASGRLVQQLQAFSLEQFAGEVHEAWQDYNMDPSPAPLEEGGAELQLFIPYFLFDWDPDPPSRRNPPRPGIVAELFLEQEGSRLPELERLILEQALTQPLSFYEVVTCQPGVGMELRDVLIGGDTETVTERAGSEHLRRGDIIYAQFCVLPGSKTLGRFAPLRIPPEHKPTIVALRTELRKKVAKRNRALNVVDLLRHRDLIRGEYLDLRDRMHTPPRLTNTDGDPFILHTLTYRVASAYAAFEALAPLALNIPKKELLKFAEFDPDGALLKVELPWQKKGNKLHSNWDGTILGMIKISGRSLVVEVNSEKRALKMQKEIDRRLGILAVHQETVTSDPVESLRQSQESASREQAPGATAKSSTLYEVPPEMRADMQREVEHWVNQKVPALGGRTPFEAVCDPEGKELVEALLLGWERRNEAITDAEAFRPDIDAIRRLLQLTTHSEARKN